MIKPLGLRTGITMPFFQGYVANPPDILAFEIVKEADGNVILKIQIPAATGVHEAGPMLRTSRA